jgi:hypothetical protein
MGLGEGSIMHTESATVRAYTGPAPARVVVEREPKSAVRVLVAGIVLSYVLFGLALFLIWKALAVALAMIF